MGLIESLVVASDKKVLLVVMDGLGGVPQRGETELESAWTPNLDRLAANSALGLHIPVGVGITPGSGPAHMALFGYDAEKCFVGRGVIEALGIGFDVCDADLCCRANFATVDKDGNIADRRAGRIATEKAALLCRRLQQAIGRIEDVEVIVQPGREHRFVVVFRGQGLEDGLTESDPQHTGIPPLTIEPLAGHSSRKSAAIANEFIARAARELAGEEPANFVLLRGLARLPAIESLQKRFKLRPACAAVYPMYKGLARLVGMRVLEAGADWQSEVDAVRKHKSEHDFVYLHFKDFDKAGEDGDFGRKAELFEEFDTEIVPQLEGLGFDVLCITGDHSTPAMLKGHSWHPVPFLINSPCVRSQVDVLKFGERACMRGSVGYLKTVELMPLLLAHAGKLAKFGA